MFDPSFIDDVTRKDDEVALIRMQNALGLFIEGILPDVSGGVRPELVVNSLGLWIQNTIRTWSLNYEDEALLMSPQARNLFDPSVIIPPEPEPVPEPEPEPVPECICPVIEPCPAIPTPEPCPAIPTPEPCPAVEACPAIPTPEPCPAVVVCPAIPTPEPCPAIEPCPIIPVSNSTDSTSNSSSQNTTNP